MIILGVGDSHEAHACVLRDGELVAAMAEERLSRLKADMGYPKRAIESVLSCAGISPSEIDVVAVAGVSGSAFQRLYKLNALFSVQHWIEQNQHYWRPILLEGKKLSPLDDFERFAHLRGDGLRDDPYFPFIEQARKAPEASWPRLFNQIRRQTLVDHLGVDPSRIHFFRHEDCHKAYGYYSTPYKRERALVLTLEGGGDDSSATVSVMEDGEIAEAWRSNAVQVGRLYRYVTLLLGMKPAQHEYKVMGLAPYGSEYHGRRSLEFFRKINQVEGTRILNTATVRDLYYSVRDALEGERFDGIAWGLQTWVEEILTQWIEANVREHNCDNVILSGGVAQNIKACKAVLEMPAVRQLWVGPIAGDGSLGIGAAWLAHKQTASTEIRGLPTTYLGTSWDKKAIAKAIGDNALADNFTMVENPEPARVAGWLADGLIMGRFSGRMEFGQRALGNRSILADPRRRENVERINQKIKRRDFWMPFTPSMLIEEADRILQNPKSSYSPFMTLAFDLKEPFANAIPAAVHSGDNSTRPQMLRREDNPAYYDLIEAFRARTGLGVVLNTSFNLHGEVIVESPEDAVSTFLRSDLDCILLENIAILRQAPK